MRILIDEQIPVKFKWRLLDTGHEIFTVRDKNWLVVKNGDLLRMMEADDINLLITNDKNLYYQQKINHLAICIVNINSKTNRYDDVFEKLGLIKNKLSEIDNHPLKNAGEYFII